MKSMLCLPVFIVIAMYSMAIATSQDPWATMGVTCDLETTFVTIRDQKGCSKSRKYSN